MPTQEHDYTMSGGRMGGGAFQCPPYDLYYENDRCGNFENDEKYDYFLDGKGNKLYLARRDSDNTPYICAYRVPKNIEAERAAFKVQTGKEPQKYFKCAWINEHELTSRMRKNQLDIYMPLSAPYIAKDLEGKYKAYAKYKVDDQVIEVQLEFMDRVLASRYNQILSLTKAQAAVLLTELLKSYNTIKQRILRGDMLDSRIKEYVDKPAANLKKR